MCKATVYLGVFTVVCDLNGMQLGDRFGGDPDDEGAIGEVCAAGDHRARADNAVFADDAAIEQHGAHADDGVIADGGAVYHGIVTDGNAFA